MRSVTVATLAVASAVLAAAGGLAATSPAAASPAPPRLAAAGKSKPVPWKLKLAIRYFPGAGNHSHYETVLVSGKTAWFFGGSNFSGHGVPEAEARTKGKWQPSALPPHLRSWISGASAVSPGDIWAVTYAGGSVLNWNGKTWTVKPKGRWNPKARFTGIVALSAGNVWLFGARGFSQAGAGTWHLSSGKWTEVRGMAADIFRASAVSATDMWGFGGIRGSMNALLHYSDGVWRHVSPAALAGLTYSYVLALSPANVWVAGSIAGSPELGHFNGHSWTTLTMPGATAATGICRDGRDGLWVIANSGFGPSVVMNRSARGDWTSAPVSATSADEVLACAWLPRTKAAWGAGKSAAPVGTAAAVYGFGKVP